MCLLDLNEAAALYLSRCCDRIALRIVVEARDVVAVVRGEIREAQLVSR